MPQTFYIVDAFTQSAFSGNPAAVTRLAKEISTHAMQTIAAEFNLSETAFLIPEGNGYRIRWFTPTAEVPLCGHATLAAAHTLKQLNLIETNPTVFESASGPLGIHFKNDMIWLDFPITPVSPIAPPTLISDHFGDTLKQCYQGPSHLVIELTCPQAVKAYTPKLDALLAMPFDLITLCANNTNEPSSNSEPFDFICRVFAPKIGINEDPVTGSIYTLLAPIFAKQLNKTKLHAFQASKRGGEVFLHVGDTRIEIGGHAITVMTTQLHTEL